MTKPWRALVGVLAAGTFAGGFAALADDGAGAPAIAATGRPGRWRRRSCSRSTRPPRRCTAIPRASPTTGDAASGALQRTIATRGAGDTAPTFVNDLGVTGDGDIFATDSFRLVIYRVGLDDDEDHDRSAPDIDEIRLRGGTINGGDGLLMDRGRMIVVPGSNLDVANGANGTLTFIELRRHRTRATVVANRTDPSLAGPSTAVRTRDRYLVAAASFAGPADGPFTVSGLDRGSGGDRGRRGNGARR